MTSIHISDLGDLVAGLPTLLGFHPRGLVVVSVAGDRLGMLMRIDLPPAPADGDDHDHDVGANAAGDLAYAAQVAEAAVAARIATATLIMIEPRPRWDLASTVGTALYERGVEVRDVVWAQTTTRGGAWRCADGCHRGLLPDPAHTTLATANAVLNGRAILPDRDAVVAAVQPVDATVLAHRARLLQQVMQAADQDPAPETAIEQAVGAAAAGRLVLDDDVVVRLARALADPHVRDGVALGYCLGEHAVAAAYLWQALTRETPPPHVAEPAVLLAISALLDGDGVLVNAALDRADHAVPDHRLARLLRLAGLRPPHELRQILEQLH